MKDAERQQLSKTLNAEIGSDSAIATAVYNKDEQALTALNGELLKGLDKPTANIIENVISNSALNRDQAQNAAVLALLQSDEALADEAASKGVSVNNPTSMMIFMNDPNSLSPEAKQKIATVKATVARAFAIRAGATLIQLNKGVTPGKPADDTAPATSSVEKPGEIPADRKDATIRGLTIALQNPDLKDNVRAELQAQLDKLTGVKQ